MADRTEWHIERWPAGAMDGYKQGDIAIVAQYPQGTSYASVVAFVLGRNEPPSATEERAALIAESPETARQLEAGARAQQGDAGGVGADDAAEQSSQGL